MGLTKGSFTSSWEVKVRANAQKRGRKKATSKRGKKEGERKYDQAGRGE